MILQSLDMRTFDMAERSLTHRGNDKIADVINVFTVREEMLHFDLKGFFSRVLIYVSIRPDNS